jgi:hypothetical protein
MLKDSPSALIEPMRNSAGSDPLALGIQKQASDDRPHALRIPAPAGRDPGDGKRHLCVSGHVSTRPYGVCLRAGVIYLQAFPFSIAVSTFAAAVRVRLKQLPNVSFEM